MHKLQLFGRIQTRNYDDKDGKKVYVTEVIGEEVYFAGGTGNSSNTGNSTNMNQAPAQHFSSEETVDFNDFNEDEFKIETEDDIEF